MVSKIGIYGFLLLLWVSPVEAMTTWQPSGVECMGREDTLFLNFTNLTGWNSGKSLDFITEKKYASFNYVRRWDLSELDSFHFSITFPAISRAFSIDASGFGKTLYRERSAGISIISPLSWNLLVIARGHATRIDLVRYGADHSFGMDISFYRRIRSFVIGIGSHSFLQTSYRRFGGSPNSQWSGGLMWFIDPKAILLLESNYEERYSVSYSIGLESELNHLLVLRFGYRSDTEQISFGGTIRFNNIHAITAFSFHPLLGVTRGFGLLLDGW